MLKSGRVMPLGLFFLRVALGNLGSFVVPLWIKPPALTTMRPGRVT